MELKLHCYTLRVITRYDAYHNVILDRYFTKEYRHAQGTNEGQAARNSGVIGPYDAFGSIHRVPCKQHGN